MSDLETLIKSNDELLDAYLDEQYKTRASEENSEEEDQEDEEEIQDLLLAHGEDDEDAEDDVTEDNKGALAQDDEDEIDLEIKDLLAPFSDREGDMQRIAYDRSAMTLLTNSFANQDRDSSPFRMANFDLLLLLSTQESIHRVLKDQKEENDIADYEWLRDFYTERVKDHFDGHQTYGRAEDFLVDLLKTPPIIQESGNGEFHIIDPMGMAEDIIRERSEVAKEWKDLVAEAPSEHTDLRRLLLVRRMNDATEKTLADSSPIEIEEKASSDYEVGAFE